LNAQIQSYGYNTRQIEPEKQLERHNESIHQYRWGLANIAVALICVAISGNLFVIGYIKGGLIVVATSGLAFFNATTHRKAKRFFV
jgi:hypothetical protein